MTNNIRVRFTVAAPVARYVLSTPDLQTEPTLRSFWLVALTALTACAGLLVALAGLAMIASALLVTMPRQIAEI